MCLAIPGRVVAWIDRDPLFASAEVEFEGIRRRCHMACVPEVEPGDYVIVHAGIAISRVDEAAAHQALAELRACGEEAFTDDQRIRPLDPESPDTGGAFPA
jgi:hydrogenase expression/formation protein HypC